MAAFTSENPSDRAAFDAHWAKIRASDAIINRSVEVDGKLSGHVASFEMFEERDVTYWIGREFLGKPLLLRRYVPSLMWIQLVSSMDALLIYRD